MDNNDEQIIHWFVFPAIIVLMVLALTIPKLVSLQEDGGDHTATQAEFDPRIPVTAYVVQPEPLKERIVTTGHHSG